MSDAPRAPSPGAADRAGRRGTPPSQAARILVADDDRITRELLSTILRAQGYSVEAVEDGQQAVERAARGGVDLVLLDIMMPRLSGLEACRILKGLTADTFLPIVLVTVKTDSQSRVEGLKLGADDYVCKPFDETELIARLEAMLRIKRLHDHVNESRKRLEMLSVHDELTGAYNYRYLHTRLSEEFKRAERYHDPVACALIDIDGLQAVNERGGQSAGDAVIRGLADVIRRCVRDVDVVARFGGDEFLVVLPSTHFGGGVSVAERIWREFQGRDEARSKRGALTSSVSIGVALYPSKDVKTKDALLRAADTALFQAKRDGGNRICVFQQQGYIYSPGAAPEGQAKPAAEPRPEGPTVPSMRDVLPLAEGARLSRDSREPPEPRSLREKGGPAPTAAAQPAPQPTDPRSFGVEPKTVPSRGVPPREG